MPERGTSGLFTPLWVLAFSTIRLGSPDSRGLKIAKQSSQIRES